MKLWLRLIVGLVVIPGSVAGLLFHLDRHGFFDLEKIEIVLVDAPERALFLKPLVANLDASLEVYRGRSLWSLEMGDISRKIAGLNWIETHSISRSWPAGLTVKIRAQEVKALYLGKNNRLIPVIRAGQMLDPVDASLAPDVAVLDGILFQARPELRQKAIELLDDIPAEGTFSRKTVSEIRWNPKEGFNVRMVRGGVDVNLGEDRFAIKAARVGQVMDYLSNRGVAVKEFDANLSKKVLVRLREPGKETGIE